MCSVRISETYGHSLLCTTTVVHDTVEYSHEGIYLSASQCLGKVESSSKCMSLECPLISCCETLKNNIMGFFFY